MTDLKLFLSNLTEEEKERLVLLLAQSKNKEICLSKQNKTNYTIITRIQNTVLSALKAYFLIVFKMGQKILQLEIVFQIKFILIPPLTLFPEVKSCPKKSKI